MKILVTVDGGVVDSVAVFDAPKDCEVIVHDYDEISNGDTPMSKREFDQSHWFSDGQTVERFAQQLQLRNENYRELPLI